MFDIIVGLNSITNLVFDFENLFDLTFFTNSLLSIKFL